MPTTDDLSIDPEDAADLQLVDEDGSFDSQSIRSSVLDYVYANGRRYHAFRAGNWVVPNDETEQDRMDLLHHVWKSLLGGECLRFGNRASQINRVLDVGTGTGLWAIDMADAYPAATVVGIDLSPIQPGWIPPNCFFFVDDAEQSPWGFETQFDVVHLRNMEGAFRDWAGIYRHVFENVRPGGIVEIQAQDVWIYSLDKEVPEVITEWQNMLLGASRSFGRDLSMTKLHKRFVEEAGFSEVEQVEYNVPIGPWAKHNKNVAEVFLAVVLDAIESYSLELFTRELHISVNGGGRGIWKREEHKVNVKQLPEVKKIIENVQQALMDMSNHLYCILVVITGRKSP